MRWWYIPAFLWFPACGPGTSARPDDVLPPDRFRDLLVDAHLLSARDRQLSMTGIMLDPVQRHGGFDSLCAVHDIDTSAFQRSFTHYAAHPEQLKAIYEEVLTEINRRKDLPTNGTVQPVR